MNPDPRLFPPISLTASDVPNFTNGRQILSELESRIQNKQMIDDVITAPNDIVKFFGQVFPEVQRVHNAGLNKTSDYQVWEPGQNEVKIEEDVEEMGEDDKRWDVFVGGGSALLGAVIQARHGDASRVLYAHDGIRGISNWKGSANSFIIRGVCPLYHIPSYNILYLLYITLRNAFHRRIHLPSYMATVKTDPQWAIVAMHLPTLLANPKFWLLGLRNQWNSLKDVGLYVRGTELNPANKTTAYTSLKHASLTIELLKQLDLPYTVLYLSNERSMSLDATLGKRKKKFQIIDDRGRMEEIVGKKAIEVRQLSDEEAISRGYDPTYVGTLTERPGSGCFSMSADMDMDMDIISHGGEVHSSSRLTTVLVKPIGNGADCEVTRVRWVDPVSGKISTTAVRSLTTSFGPSMTTLTVNPRRESRFSKMFRRSNLLDTIMYATGTTMIVLVKIDRTVIKDPLLLRKFRDDLAYSKKHYLLLAEREVDVDGRPFHIFAMQTVGGGLFPCRHAAPEYALNILSSIFPQTLQLDSPGIEYEVVSVRSCARGVTAQNFLRIGAPASNMVMVYGLGGTGMGTMVPNAVLLSAVKRQRGLLAEGKISEEQFRSRMREGRFDKIPCWQGNPFSRNYLKFYDERTSRMPAKVLFQRGNRLLRFLRSCAK